MMNESLTGSKQRMINISYRSWGNKNDQPVYLFKLENAKGSYVEITSYGASLVAVCVPDRTGKLENVILGFPSLEGYLNDNCYIGATIGRFANRISGAKFEIDKQIYHLDENDPGRATPVQESETDESSAAGKTAGRTVATGNTNHGGYHGFNAKVFDFNITDDVLSLSLYSEDGEGGFPGNLDFKVSYQWTDDNELFISYSAVSDQKTVANFTNHAYFNLSAGRENVFNHRLSIYAGQMLEMKAGYLPSGAIIPVAEQSFEQHKIIERMTAGGNGILEADNQTAVSANQLSGLNSCYLLGEKESSGLRSACLLTDEQSGRTLEVSTSYPGLLLYTGDYLNSQIKGHHSACYKPFDGVCLECQYFPDSPNQGHFPSTILSPGDLFQEHIKFKFSIKA